MFKKATRKQAKLRLAIQGPSGSGKTTWALTIASGLGSKTALGDTERGSASLYASHFNFDTVNINNPYEPEKFIECIKAAEDAGYDTLIIDSYTHEWLWCLEMANKLAQGGGNSFTAWAKITPRHDALVNAILNSSIHIICCMRSKQEYVMEEGKNGKQVPKKVGMAAVQRDGLDYEFTIVFELGMNHMANCTKDRSKLFADKDVDLSSDIPRQLINWLNEGDLAPTAVVDPFSGATSIEDVKAIWSTNKSKQTDPVFKKQTEEAKARFITTAAA